MVDNRVFLAGLKKANDELKDLMALRVMQSTRLLQSAIQREAPSDTGRMRAQMPTNVERTASAIVGSVSATAGHAAFVHEGTGIYAKGGNGRKTPWRYFVATGRYKGWHVTRGQKPNQFMVRAVNASRSDIARILGAL